MDFLSIQDDYWHDDWQNRHAFMWELSKNHRVFFLSPPFYLAKLLNKSVPKRTTMKSGCVEIKKNLYSYIPSRFLPYNYRFTKLDQLVKTIRHRLIESELRKKQFSRPVIIVWHPRFARLVDDFDKSLLVYYKYDHYQGYFGGEDKSDVDEQTLIKQADLMLVTSRGLYDMHKNDTDDLHLVPNAVDFDLFSKTLTDKVKVPGELDEISQPRIGYVGVINEKVDFKLLSHLCKSRPDWSIVLVGPERVRDPEFRRSLEELKNHKNCYFLGQKPGRDVPAYIKGLDVCMMCYLVNDWTYYGYPLKMHEYLACGKPSISADLPAVRDFKEVVVIPDSYDDWVVSIENALSDGESPDLIDCRLEVAKQNSWEVRVQILLDLIKEKT